MGSGRDNRLEEGRGNKTRIFGEFGVQSSYKHWQKKIVAFLKSTDPAFHFSHWAKHGPGSWEQSSRQRKLVVFCWYPWGDADFHCREIRTG